MNKVIIINLNGLAFQLEEAGYTALQTYLETATRGLTENPDKDEIIADIEQAIAEKFRAVLGASKTVVLTKEVNAVITEMGPVQDTSEATPAAGRAGARESSAESNTGASSSDNKTEGSRPVRRLYRIYDGAIVSGVCNGIAAYFNIDATLVRIAFLILCCLWGTGILLYFAMMIIMPTAKTAKEKAEATGAATTAEEFIRRAKAGYYEGMKSFHDKKSRWEWKRKMKREMKSWKQGFKYSTQSTTCEAAQPFAPCDETNGVAFARPFIGLLRFLCQLVAIYGVFTLVMHREVLGLPLPSSVPLWIGVILFIIVYKILTWPLKVLHHASKNHYSTNRGWRRSAAGPLDGVVWLLCLLILLWLGDRHVPEIHEWLQNLPSEIHQFSDSVQAWWSQHHRA